MKRNLNNCSNNSLVFTKRMTSCAKGLALILLIIHHVIPNNPGVNLSISDLSFSQVLATSAKACVSIFMILSGYGMCFKFSQTDGSISEMAGAVRNRLTKFWSTFIPMYFFSLLLSTCIGISFQSIYGNGFFSILYLVKDMLGLASEFVSTPTLCGAWWYLGAAICCYLLAPLFYKIISKGNFANSLLLIAAYLPWLFYFVSENPNMHTDRELFYFFAFILGMTMFKHDFFAKYLQCGNIFKIPVVCLGLLGFIVARLKFNLMVDSFIAFCLILLMTHIGKSESEFGNLFNYLGLSSGRVYMFHVSLLGALSYIPFINLWVKIFFCLFLCLAINDLLVRVGKRLSSSMVRSSL